MQRYLKIIAPLLKQFALIKIQRTIENRVGELVLKLLDVDNLNILRDKTEGMRFYENFTGRFLSTYAIGKLIEEDVVDFELTSVNKKYSPNLKKIGLDININYCEYGDFHIVDKKPKKPIIFVIRKNLFDFIICGFADTTTIKKYSVENKNQSLASARMLKEFIGYEHLKQFKSVEELKSFLD